MSFDEPPDPQSRDDLQLEEFVFHVSDIQVWRSGLTPQHGFAVLARLLRAGTARSATLVATPPPPEKRWVTIEWVGKLLVPVDLIESVHSLLDGWQRVQYFEPERLEVWKPPAQRDSEEPAPVEERIKLAESADEFRSAIDANEPAVAHYQVPEQISEALLDEKWFGPLATSGGVIALLTMSRAVPGHPALLRTPAALHLEVSAPMTDLRSLTRDGGLRVVAAGVSRGDELPRSFIDACLEDGLSTGIERVNQELTEQLAALHDGKEDYRLLIYMSAPLVDPEVVIPTGAVFEQTSFNGVQTLAAAAHARVVVKPGSYAPVALPAWCLNRPLKPPHGQAVSPTALRYKGTGSQWQVWKDLDERLHARP